MPSFIFTRSSSTLRTIVCDASAQFDLEGLGNLPRIDDALAGLSGAFDAHPERYPTIGETGLRVARFVFFDGAPPVRILFTATVAELRIVAAQVDPEQLNDTTE